MQTAEIGNPMDDLRLEAGLLVQLFFPGALSGAKFGAAGESRTRLSL